jgi:hypothetical protein
MLSTASIERSFSLLLLDTTNNEEGWEYEVSAKLLAVLEKRGVTLVEARPLHVSSASQLYRHPESLAAASCIILLGSSNGAPDRFMGLWNGLSAHIEAPTIAVVCLWGTHLESLTDAVLKLSPDWAPIALAQESDIAPRAGALFLLKFITELELHSDERMTGRMAWFAWKKAAELLKRRGLSAKFGLRA